MKLRLAITSYQRALLGDKSVRVFDAAGGSIGRAAGNDWVLEDSSRVLSARHAVVAYDAAAGRFVITDLSTNGVFLNDAEEPLGRDRSAALQNGDRVTLGDYELAVKIEYADATGFAPPLDPLAMLDRAEATAPRPQAILPDEWDPAALLAPEPLLAPARAPTPAPALPPDFDPLVVLVPAPSPLAPSPLGLFDPAVLARRWGLDDPAALWARYAREYPALAAEAAAMLDRTAGKDRPR